MDVSCERTSQWLKENGIKLVIFTLDSLVRQPNKSPGELPCFRWGIERSLEILASVTSIGVVTHLDPWYLRLGVFSSGLNQFVVGTYNTGLGRPYKTVSDWIAVADYFEVKPTDALVGGTNLTEDVMAAYAAGYAYLVWFNGFQNCKSSVHGGQRDVPIEVYTTPDLVHLLVDIVSGCLNRTDPQSLKKKLSERYKIKTERRLLC